jgi:hypothetical protein
MLATGNFNVSDVSDDSDVAFFPSSLNDPV